MSVILINKRAGRGTRFHEHGWGYALTLALQHGWSPMGVTACQPNDCLDEDAEGYHMPSAGVVAPQEGGLPPAEAWAAYADSLAKIQAPIRATPNGGSYFDREEGWVKAKDAAALGKAIEMALPDIPRHDALQPKTYTSSLHPGRQLFDFDTLITASEWFSGPKRQVLQGFISMCRLGGFVMQRRTILPAEPAT
jgi:hypothetical protein